jgi:DNA-binding response OmpR family regulator
MQGTVLVVAEDEAAARRMQEHLERERFEVAAASSGAEALAMHRKVQPDVLVLDLVLPDIDGLDVCRRIRKESEVPLIIVSSRPTELDRVLGLEIGADDYVVKPYDTDELMERVKAALRRVRSRESRRRNSQVLDFGTVRIDRAEHNVTVNGETKRLTPMELKLLWTLAERAGHVMPSERLLMEVWGYPESVKTRTLDVHIGRLRKKLQENGDSPRHIITVPRVGYKFQPQAAAAKRS